jgi:SPOR domain/PilZ domain
MLQERRQHLRVAPDRPLLVRWGESEIRLIFDLCEEGLAVDGFAAVSPAEIITLVFDLPGDRGHIQARGKIAWTNDSDDRAGLRFVGMAGNSRQQLRQWISARTGANKLAITRKEPAWPVSVTHEIDFLDLLDPRTRANEGLSRHRTSHYLMWLVLSVLLFSAIVFLRHYPGVEDSRQVKEIMAAGKAPEVPSAGSIASVKPSPAATPSLPSALPLDAPGFVLQVAAMKHEDNANALAETLQKENFPAFVFKRGADPFYRVAVGTYSDPDSALRVKDELKAQGFQSILKRWSPV